jgi:molecular chaperone DnaK (HSP70)
MLPRKPYKGLTRKLVIAFDVGTTFSGVSYCLLDPGEVPVIRGVSRSVITRSVCILLISSHRYPGQDQVSGDSKIPSIIYYDLQGEIRAVGAEALQEHIIEQAKDMGWVKLEWCVYRAGSHGVGLR